MSTLLLKLNTLWLRLDDSAPRRQTYLVLTCVFFAAGVLLSTGKAIHRHEQLDFVLRDAEGYYVYLPTIVLDHDLDFRNQLLAHATLHAKSADAADAPQGALRNRFPIGVALTLAPAFYVAHETSLALFHLTGKSFFEPNGYTLVYQLLCSAFAMVIGLWGMCMADAMLSREFGFRGRVVALAVLVYWVGTNYAYYFFHEPFMAHVISATWVIASAAICQRIIAGARGRVIAPWHWVALSLCVSMAVICRYTNASFAPLLLITAVAAIRAGQLQSILKWSPLIFLGALPLLVQVLVSRELTGGYAALTPSELGYYAQERFYWSDPSLLKTLISSRHGLFFWSPVLFVSFIAVARYISRGGWRNAWLVGLVLNAITLWYLNSAWWCWSYGTSFGHRASIEMAPMFLVGFAIAFDQLTGARRWLRTGVYSFVVQSIAYSYVMMGLYYLKFVPRDDYLFAPPRVRPPPFVDSYYPQAEPDARKTSDTK